MPKPTTPIDPMRKLHPWLRVVQDGDGVVNAVRSDGSARVACSAPIAQVSAAPLQTELTQAAAAMPRATERIERPTGRLPKQHPLVAGPPADSSMVNVFIEFYPQNQGNSSAVAAEMARVQSSISAVEKSIDVAAEAEEVAGAPSRLAGPGLFSESVTRRNLMCATVPVSMLSTLCDDPAIAFVHPSEPLKLDHPDVSPVVVKTAPKSKAIGTAAKNGRGKGVLIGIIDVNGFDFAHSDFLDDNGDTRFIAIWDQGGNFRKPPARFGYGSEFTDTELNKAIKAANKNGLPSAPYIERQSQLQPGSHGTHVASIAAGNTGVCPEAKIAAVLIDIPVVGDEVARRRSTFSDTSRITHAVEYLLDIAEQQKLPIAINISLGTNGGSHDGASGVSRWLDAYLSAPGRAICIAAGNAGQQKALSDGDLGWVMGRIHTSGRVASRGLEVELEWAVVGDGIEDWSENELEIWYGAQDRFIVSVKPPDSDKWIEVKPRQFVQNLRLPSGIRLSIYNELYHPTNGGNYVAIYMSPNFDPDHFRGIPKGIWKVRIKGDEVRDGRFHAWIERDDPLEIGRMGERRLFRFPSFFTEKTNVDSHSITSLACGQSVIAVANLDDARQRINASSSQGPTRDGRCKPEIAAPGTDVIAANGFADPQQLWIAMTGTSMASPYVTGVVGLMLDANPSLTSAQCLGILQRTARPLAGASYEWLNDVGFGRIDPQEAINEARLINSRDEILGDKK
jgi:subtilisin family serine protease